MVTEVLLWIIYLLIGLITTIILMYKMSKRGELDSNKIGEDNMSVCILNIFIWPITFTIIYSAMKKQEK